MGLQGKCLCVGVLQIGFSVAGSDTVVRAVSKVQASLFGNLYFLIYHADNQRHQ